MVDEINESAVEAESQDNEELSIGSLDDLRNLEAEEAPVENLDASANEVVEPKADDVEEAVEYTPDFTYKVKDETFEFDEAIREAIKSKEVEDKFRDLYTRAAGLDDYKSKYSDIETKYNEAQPQLERMVGGYQNLMKFRDEGDMDRLMEVLGVTEEQLLDHAESLLARYDLPEEQQQAMKQNRELTDKYNSLESQFNNLQQKQQSDLIAAERRELDGLLGDSEYASGVELMKEVGLNFEDEVIKAGEAIFNESGNYPTVKQAFEAAYKLREPLLNRLMAQTQQTTEPEAPAATERVVERQPTLPQVKGANSNKVDEVISFDKLREISNAIPTR